MNHRIVNRALVPLTLASTLAGCSLFDISPLDRTSMTEEQRDYTDECTGPALEKVTDRSQYPDFGAGYGRKDDLLKALDGTLDYFAKPSSQRRGMPYLDVEHARAQHSIELFRDVVTRAQSAAELNQAIVDNFEVYRSKGWRGTGDVQFTGYCSPIFKASKTETPEFKYPLYRRPKELLADEWGTPTGWGSPGSPSPTRAEFDAGALKGRGLELAWLRDPLEVFIVHVQGSAKLEMPDGKYTLIGYAGKTERPYSGLGQNLVAEGEIQRSELSLRAVKEWMRSHPDRAQEYMQKNQSYVFFQEINAGPFGSLNIPVTAFRTLATDMSRYPPGGIAFVNCEIGSGTGGHAPFNQFMVDQDTGGAIRACGRADIYTGIGPEAEAIAGDTFSVGKIWYVYAKPGK